LAVNIPNGIRASTSVTYLLPALQAPKSKVYLARGCTVTKVLFDDSHSRLGKNAEGVECIDYFGKTHQLYASREVILAAGNFGTAKILYYSGIGPRDILQAWNLPQRVINEKIGQKIMNQQSVGMKIVDSSLQNANFYNLPLASTQFAAEGTGLFSGARGAILYAKVNPANPTNDISISCTIGTGTPSSTYDNTIHLAVGLTFQSYQNGSMNLTSTNPLANITWNANIFAVQNDVTTLALGILLARTVIAQWPNATEVSPGPSYTTLAQLEQFVRDNGSISGHYSGSVPLGETDDYPLDLNLLVRGVKNLRVVDPSSFHAQVSQGMQIPAAVMGLKGADLIIADHLN